MSTNLLRHLPSVNELINLPEVRQIALQYSQDLVVNSARVVLDELRKEISETKPSSFQACDLSKEKIAGRLITHLKKKITRSLRPAINATGVILHTGLGRAVLPQKAIDAVEDILGGYSTLATDTETGRRGHRDMHLNALLCELTGAESATVVNNNAAATMLILNTLAKGKEVIVSRGQLVEIGGSFRMPEVMQTSGAVLKEVGTTNKTHLKDYSDAVNENTGAILRVHQSNYRIVGFAGEPSVAELVKLARKHNLPVIDDLGSGALVNLENFGLGPEPLVQDSLRAGVDVACFSGDKLIGGPQAGIIVGTSPVIERIRKNPLARAMRIGKMTIAAMEVTLKMFLNQARLADEHPVYRMISLKPAELEKRIRKVMETLRELTVGETGCTVVDGDSQVGSGSLPTETISSRLLRIKPARQSAETLARKLRQCTPPIFARIQKESVLFDFRTIQPDEDTLIQEALAKLLKAEGD